MRHSALHQQISAGILLPESFRHTEFYAILASFVAINTVMFAALAIAKILPRVYFTDVFPGRHHRAETRSIYPDDPSEAAGSHQARTNRGNTAYTGHNDVPGLLPERQELGYSYMKIADSDRSAMSLRSRRDEWITAGIFTRLEQICLGAYHQMIGLDLEDVAIDGANRHDSPLLRPTLEKLNRFDDLSAKITGHLDADYDSTATRELRPVITIADAIEEIRELRRRNRLLEQEAEVMRRAVG